MQLKPYSKYVAGYLFTGPQTNRIGLYHFSLGMAIEDTGLSTKEFGGAIGQIFEVLSWRCDVGTKTMYIPSWWKHNVPQNENVLVGSLEDLKEVPAGPLVQQFVRNTEFLPSHFIRKFIDCVAHRIIDNKQLDYVVPGPDSPTGVGLPNGTGLVTEYSSSSSNGKKDSCEPKPGSRDLFPIDPAVKPVDSGSVDSAAMDLAAVRRVWEYYLVTLRKNRKLMDFSDTRKQKGLSRFREAKSKAGGDYEKAEQLMRLAVDAIAVSEWHNGVNPQKKHYGSWDKHLFPSLEKFEWWLEQAQ